MREFDSFEATCEYHHDGAPQGLGCWHWAIQVRITSTIFHCFAYTIYRYEFVDGLDSSVDGLDSLLKLCHIGYYIMPYLGHHVTVIRILNAPPPPTTPQTFEIYLTPLAFFCLFKHQQFWSIVIIPLKRHTKGTHLNIRWAYIQLYQVSASGFILVSVNKAMVQSVPWKPNNYLVEELWLVLHLPPLKRKKPGTSLLLQSFVG